MTTDNHITSLHIRSVPVLDQDEALDFYTSHLGFEVRDDIDRAVVRVSGEVALDTVAAILIDDRDAETDVARAVGAIDAADLGDPDAEAAVDDTEGHELGWYATQELAGVLRELDEGGPVTR